MSDFNTVTKFEQTIADFFGAPYAVATDSCTHAVELSLILTRPAAVICPVYTYISIPFMLDKLGMNWSWSQKSWSGYYYLNHNIIDAAPLWRRQSYVPGTMMCISFQYNKALPLGRGGMILLDNQEQQQMLQKMAHDGRERGVAWAQQAISMPGYHYYMTPETAAQGLEKFEQVQHLDWADWTTDRYPYLPSMPVFAGREQTTARLDI